jgi:hypothetical protein
MRSMRSMRGGFIFRSRGPLQKVCHGPAHMSGHDCLRAYSELSRHSVVSVGLCQIVFSKVSQKFSQLGNFCATLESLMIISHHVDDSELIMQCRVTVEVHSIWAFQVITKKQIPTHRTHRMHAIPLGTSH